MGIDKRGFLTLATSTWGTQVGAANVVRFQSELIVLRDDSAKIRKTKDQVQSGQQNDRENKRYRNPIRFRGRRAPSYSSRVSLRSRIEPTK